MTRKFYHNNRLSIYLLTENSSIYYIYELKTPREIFYYRSAWNYVTRFYEKKEAEDYIKQLIGVRNCDDISRFELEESKVESKIDHYRSMNL